MERATVTSEVGAIDIASWRPLVRNANGGKGRCPLLAKLNPFPMMLHSVDPQQ